MMLVGLLVALLLVSLAATAVALTRKVSSRKHSTILYATSRTSYNPFSFKGLPKLNFGGNSSPTATKSSSKLLDALVVGSGISGSTAAFYLQQKGLNVMLTDARDYCGGNLISKTKDGFLWEEGPNSFQPNPAILRFAKDIGKIDELVLADPTLPRFVYWEGQLNPLPAGIPDAVFNFKLLTWPGKIRAGLGALGLIAPRPAGEESIREFVTRHLGEEVFTRVIDPFVSGVYAGDPKKLAMRAALKKVYNLEDLGIGPGFISGAIVRMQQLAAEKKKNAERDADLPVIPGGSLGSFKNGLQSLPLRVEEIMGTSRVKKSCKLVDVARDAAGNYVCTFQNAKGAQEKISAKSVLITAPGYVTSKIVEELVPEAALLADVNYPPVASVTVAYPTTALKNGPLVGFGHLIPRAMKIRTLGTIWSSSLFPGRAPEGYTMLLNYIGGAQDVDIAKLSDDEIVDVVHNDIKKVLLKEDAPLPKVLGVRLWRQAIPQYDKGHLDILKSLEQGLKKTPGLFLGGNYRTGVAFGDCVQYGADVAADVSAYLATL